LAFDDLEIRRRKLEIKKLEIRCEKLEMCRRAF
jgi:hypothetical protein